MNSRSEIISASDSGSESHRSERELLRLFTNEGENKMAKKKATKKKATKKKATKKKAKKK